MAAAAWGHESGGVHADQQIVREKESRRIQSDRDGCWRRQTRLRPFYAPTMGT
ncbi:hypothetical protein Hanom_Chr09g00777371 [Helianthus anomalus]